MTVVTTTAQRAMKHFVILDRRLLVLFTTCLGVFVAQLDTSVVNLALKHMGAELKSGVSQLQWIVDAYNLAYASFLLIGGTLGDVYGRRLIFIVGCALFAAGSLACGLAPDNATLIGGRALSGLGAAFELPASLAILSQTYTNASERARVIGIWAGSNGVAWLIGPSVGGFIVDYLGWRGIFLLIIPFALLACVLAWTAISESRSSEKRSLDLPGQALAVMALGAFTFGFIEGPHWGWVSSWTIGCLIAAAVAAAGFIVIERKSVAPLLPLELFGTSQFSAACAIAACMTFGMYATLFLMPLYLQSGRGASAIIAGIEMLPMSLAFVLVSHVSGKIVTRFGARLAMMSGTAAMGAGQLLLAFISTDTSLLYVEVAFLIIGVGLGLNTGPVLTLAVSSAPKNYGGATAGIVNTARIVGATLGVAVLGALFAMRAGRSPTEANAIVAGLLPALIGGSIMEFAGTIIAWALIAPEALATTAVGRKATSSSG